MNIVKRELQSNLKSLIIWSIALAFLATVWMIEFESFASNPNINDFMESIPKGILSVMGMADFDIGTLNGFISGISLYFNLIFSIHGVLLGSTIISKEERDKTAEYLFTLPISREKVIVGKTIAAIINLLILNILTLTVMLLNTARYDKSENFYSFIALMFLGIFFIQMIFLSIGMLVASINKRYKRSGNISVSILMITFIISSLVGMVESLDFLKYITPFKYFEASYILNEGSLQLIFIVISILIISIGIGGSFIFYSKRDLYI